MIKDDYRAVFDGIQLSESVKTEIETQIIIYFDKKKKNRHMSRTAVIAIALAVLLIGTSLAAALSSDILSRLFRGREPSPEAEAAIVRDAGRDSANGVTLTLDEYLSDQTTLNLSWTVTSEKDEPVYYVTWSEIDDNGLTEADADKGYVPGFAYGGSDSSIGDGAIVYLAPEADTYTSWSAWGWPHGIDRPVSAKVFVRAYTTDMKAERTEYGHTNLCWAEPDEKAYEVLKAAEADGNIAMANDLPLCYVNSYDAYLSALGDSTEPEEMCTALEASGLFEPLAELTVSAEISPTAGGAYELAEPETFELPGRTVVVRTVRFDIASTLIEYDVILDGTDNADAAMYWYLVADGDRNVKNVEWALSLDGGMKEDAGNDGRKVVHYTLSGDAPVTEVPDSLTFIPICDMPWQEGESSQSYWQRVADQADSKDCFTINLK